VTGQLLMTPGKKRVSSSPPPTAHPTNRGTSPVTSPCGAGRQASATSRFHDTRRTCGSLLAALDVHPRVAMQILRHSKIAITMEIYTEVPDAEPATRCAAWVSIRTARVAVLQCCTGT
jgi:integrase